MIGQGTSNLSFLLRTKEFDYYLSRPEAGGDGYIHVYSKNTRVDIISYREFMELIPTFKVAFYFSGDRKGMLSFLSRYEYLL